MRVGFRRYADGFRIVVFQQKSVVVEWPDYMTVEREHSFLERDDMRQFLALVPHDKGLEFWRWCQVTPGVAIKLDTIKKDRFQCPSCLATRGQIPWSPPRRTYKNWHEITIRCQLCEAFYISVYSMTDLKRRRR